MRFKFLSFFLSLCFLSSLQAETKVLAFSGSLRNDSFNKKLINEAAEIAKGLGAEVTVIDLKEFPMPIYDSDLEQSEGMPESVRKFRSHLLESQVIIIATPEYNGSLSGALKNAIDWASRDEKGNGSRDAFKNKTFLVMSASIGGGGQAVLNHLTQILERLGAKVSPRQVSITNATNAFNSDGKLINNTYKLALKQEIEQSIKPSANPVR